MICRDVQKHAYWFIANGLRITTQCKTDKLDSIQTKTSKPLVMQNNCVKLPKMERLGERSWLVHWPDELAASLWGNWLRDQNRPDIEDIVVAYQSVAVMATVETDIAGLVRLESAIMASLNLPKVRSKVAGDLNPIIDVPVIYDGPDLLDVAMAAGISPEMVVAWHVSQIYDVYAVGFLPGFPYCGYLPGAIAGIPRRQTPRTRVPAGSVAIAGRQTGIYPCESPGGWHLIGHTEMEICDLSRSFFRFRAGDRIRFIADPRGVQPNPAIPAEITSTQNQPRTATLR